MSGWHTQVTGEFEPPKGVIAVVVAPKFPDLALIREKIEEGIARVHPDTVWVIREKPAANHAVTAVWDVLTEHGIEPILAPLVPAWKSAGVEREGEKVGAYDLRRKWADAELGSTCERVIVFHDKSSNVTAGWIDGHRIAKVFVIERGKKRAAPRRTGRKPAGV